MHGTDWPDETRRLLSIAADQDAEIERLLASQSDGYPPVVCVTTHVGTYPTAAKRYYALQVQTLTGNEVEGTAATLGALGGVAIILGLNLGNLIPPEGTVVVAKLTAEGKWVFGYG